MTHSSEISTIQALEAFLKRRLLNGAHLHRRGSLDLGSLSFRFIFMLVAITTRTNVYIYIYIYIYQTCICIILCERERGKFRGFSNCVLFLVCGCGCLKFRYLLKLLKWNHWYVFRITLPYKYIWTVWKWGLQWFTGEISFEQKSAKRKQLGKGRPEKTGL